MTVYHHIAMLHPRLHMLEKKKKTKTIEKLPSIDRLVLVWIQTQFHFENLKREGKITTKMNQGNDKNINK